MSKRGLWIPPTIFEMRLPPLEKMLLSDIAGLCTSFDHCYKSNALFAHELCCSERSITRAIAKLSEKGLIDVEYAGKDGKTERSIFTKYRNSERA